MKKRLFSGCTPSGNLTLGNYLGTIRGWEKNQETCDALFAVTDLHALTVPRDREIVRRKSLDFLCLFMACGIDPQKSTLFIQSHNPRHCEVSWILSCQTGWGELSRMTQFKSKSAGNKRPSGGLLTYPVLMAADILLYGTELVPVGEDQTQHMELTRRLAERLNSCAGPVFPLPEALIPPSTGRVANLLDPTAKMDKSHGNRDTYIALTDTPEEIRRKIGKARTDSRGDFALDDKDSGIGNLVRIYSALTGLGTGTIIWEYEHRDYGAFKRDLGDIIVDSLTPIREKYNRIRREEDYLKQVLALGKEKALEKSERAYKCIKDTFGLISC